jgi:hypothetical protein
MLFRVVHPSSRPRSARLRAGILATLVLHGAPGSARAAQDEAAFRERAAFFTTRHGAEITENVGVALLLERAFLRIELAAFERVYQRPLSATGAPSIEEDLAGQFPTWLSRY